MTTTCQICDNLPTRVPPPWSVAIITVVVALCVLALLWDAKGRGARWVTLLLGGILFGEIVEALNVNNVFGSGCHSYCYPDVGPVIFGVPLWVPVGWGGIIYAATWTAHHLNIHWFARAITAAFLAVSIDFSLDPVANLLGFWSWDAPPANFLGVPYDNFAAWFLVVLVYSATATFFLRRWGHHWRAAPGAPAPTTRWSVWAQVLTILLCEVIAFGLLAAIIATASHFGYSPRVRAGHVAAGLFMLALGVGVVGTLIHVRIPRPPNPNPGRRVSWTILLVPVIMHVISYVLYFAYVRWQEPALIAAIPLQLLAGVFVFAQPWL